MVGLLEWLGNKRRKGNTGKNAVVSVYSNSQ
jgi:hypothetical protein